MDLSSFGFQLASSLSRDKCHPKQQEFINSCEGLLRAGLTGHSHLSPFLKNAKMSLFNPCMKFDFFWLKAFIWSAKKVPFWDFFQNVSQAPFKCLSKWIKVYQWNYLKKSLARINCGLFRVPTYESLERLEGKTREAPFFKVQSGRITVWTDTFSYYKKFKFKAKIDIFPTFSLINFLVRMKTSLKSTTF